MSEQDNKRQFSIRDAVMTAPRLEPALYLVATPIGNLGDITIRALETLAGADIVACEDTRVTRVLLERYGMRRRMTAYHEHNATEAGPKLLNAIEGGQSVALASDAGTPLISDPGFRLVSQAQERGLRVVPIPGASAVLAALTASGLPTDAFLFAGFLPNRSGQRESRLSELATSPATLVFFESPRRLAASLAAMASLLGEERQAVVARELTKTFEEVRAGSLAELAEHYEAAGAPKGEVVVCVAPPLAEKTFDAADTDRLLLSLAGEMSAAKAAGEAARMTGAKKSTLYQRLLELKDAAG
ncbi:Uroporphyrin-III C/tetrapyrrole (Corrin/Porphyrin) methyltransferase [Nitratireductor basaltis]|uniref:Ribosomal RNA small subunit methyltransferase I n=2 Tax=Nitratireductor basaltis TaxID=472175 RepID=A0A084U600_9HYPH|nr:Uroporphyrin-III C/tetrapyrrole (Corrin/Porphyrin) methyltransferase [Nitratireductor basaltis]